MDVNSLIHNQQQSTGALIATGFTQVIIRQGNWYINSCFLNTRLTISGLGTIPITGRHISRTTAPKFGISEALSRGIYQYVSQFDLIQPDNNQNFRSIPPAPQKN
jgi:hypothetical protein